MNRELMNMGDYSPGAAASSLVASTDVTPWRILRSRVADYCVLVKARLSLLVLVVAAVGFCLGSPGPIHAILLVHTVLGIALVAFGANALNQYMERGHDGLMRRTADRPLPAGRLSPLEGLLVGLSCAAAGLLNLAAFVNPPATALAAATLLLYLFAYTPLKRITVWNTLVGAIPGALPPVIGYAAASGRVDLFAALLFVIVFIWQMPHFYAIAWMYRDDYARGGYRMLSLDDSEGRATGLHSVVFSCALIVAGLLPALVGFAGLAAGVGCGLLGVVMLSASFRLARRPAHATARAALLTSLVYLPGVMVLLLVDRTTAW